MAGSRTRGEEPPHQGRATSGHVANGWDPATAGSRTGSEADSWDAEMANGRRPQAREPVAPAWEEMRPRGGQGAVHNDGRVKVEIGILARSQ